MGTEEQRNSRYRGIVGKEEQWVQRNRVTQEQWVQRNSGHTGTEEQ